MSTPIDQNIFHDCKNCGYRISDAEYMLAKHAYRCPRCNATTIDFFRTVVWPLEEV
jgi:predicted Zn-ribbon and HTH transcriptional regulator